LSSLVNYFQTFECFFHLLDVVVFDCLSLPSAHHYSQLRTLVPQLRNSLSSQIEQVLLECGIFDSQCFQEFSHFFETS